MSDQVEQQAVLALLGEKEVLLRQAESNLDRCAAAWQEQQEQIGALSEANMRAAEMIEVMEGVLTEAQRAKVEKALAERRVALEEVVSATTVEEVLADGNGSAGAT